MVKRDIGTTGYYAQHKKDEEDERKQSSDHSLSMLAIALLFILLLLLFQSGFLFPREADGTEVISPPGTSPSPGSPTPGTGTGTATPAISPTATAKPTSTPENQSTKTSRYLYNVTIGPYNVTVGNTIIRVTKKALANETLYSERIILENVGGKNAEFKLFDVLPPSFNATISQARFASPDYELVSEQSAGFPYSMAPGQIALQGPDSVPVENASEPINSFLLGAAAEDSITDIEDLLYYRDVPNYEMRTTLIPGLLSGYLDPEDYDYDRDDALYDGMNALDDLETQRQIDDQLGTPAARGYNYSRLKNITIYVRESRPAKNFTVPLDQFHAGMLFKTQENLSQYAEIRILENSTNAVFEFNFSKTMLSCGSFPFDELHDVLNFSFPGDRSFYAPNITVYAIHDALGDFSLGGFGGYGSCADSNKLILEARRHLGQMPGAFGCPSPGCACYASTMYENSGLRLFPHNDMAAGIFQSIEQKAASGKARVLTNPRGSELQQGDLLFFVTSRGQNLGRYKGIGHVSIYMGNNLMIHSGGSPVRTSPVSSYYKPVSWAGRVLDCGANNSNGTAPVDVYNVEDPWAACQSAAGCGVKSAIQTPPTPAGCGGSSRNDVISSNKFYYLTYFGCSGGKSDPGDNCIGGCPMISSVMTTKGMKQLDRSSGPAYENSVEYFSANMDEYGCNKKLKVTNPRTGQAAVVLVVDAGPHCRVQDNGVKFDISYVAQKAIGDPNVVKVEKMPDNTPIGPVPPCS